MEKTKKLAKALLFNNSNPKLAWQLFKRIISSPNPSNSFVRFHYLVPLITRILLRAKMLPEIDAFRQLLLSLPLETSHACLLTTVRILAVSGHLGEAISHFRSIRTHFSANPPSVSMYNFLIESCLRENSLGYISWLYDDLVSAGHSPETYTFNLLIGRLCDSGRMGDAQKLFDKMGEKGCRPNEFSFGILIRGYCRAGLASRGLELLDGLKHMGLYPNTVIYNTLISTFCGEGKTDQAEKLVERMRKDDLLPDAVTFNSRISALCSAGKIIEASRIFRDMQLDVEMGLPRPNIITYNLMLEGFFKQGMLEEAKTLVQSMKRNGAFTKVESYNVWFMGLARNGKLVEAQSVLKEMAETGIELNVYSYNIMIDGLCKKGMLTDARLMLCSMIGSQVPPDTVTYSTLLHAYCKKGKVLEANNVLNEMVKSRCLPNSYTCNILLHSLWKEGKLSEAESLLQEMKKKGYGVDTVTCNIVIYGLCRSGKVDKAVEIVSEMWNHGSAALGYLDNSFINLMDDNNNWKECMPDLITYSSIITGLCNAGRLDEAKRKFAEMTGRNLLPDSIVYDIFIHSFCKVGKVSSAFRVLKEMERKGCNKRLQTFNSLIVGLGSKNQIFEMYGLMDEMRERGVSPNVLTYNSMISSLCEAERPEDAIYLLDEMLQKGISPNLSSFGFLIKASCKRGEYGIAREVFDIAHTTCGHKVLLYSMMFNELLAGGEILEAKALLEASLDRSFDIGSFPYKDLINTFCKDGNLEAANDILKKMVHKRYWFEPASFMPVIDGLGKRGMKHEADELAERMLEMASDGNVANKVRWKPRMYGGNDWQAIVHRDDGSGIALKTLKRVQKGWGQGSTLSLQPQKIDYLDIWDGIG